MVQYFGFTTEVRTTLLFYIYGSWVSKRILILRDRIPNSRTEGDTFAYLTQSGEQETCIKSTLGTQVLNKGHIWVGGFLFQ